MRWKPFEGYVDHAPMRSRRESFVFDLAGFMISIPVADGMAVVAFDAVNGDGGRQHICEIASEPGGWAGIALFDESDEAEG